MGIGNSPSITGPYNAEGLGGHRLGQREYNLGLVDELAAGQGLEDAQVHLVAALGDEVGNHRGIDYEVLQIEFALIEKREEENLNQLRSRVAKLIKYYHRKGTLVRHVREL